MPAFVPTGSLAAPRSSFAAARLAGGKVLVAGGVREAQLYDPDDGVWVGAGQLNGDHLSPRMTALPNGGAALVGGDPDGADALVEVWDIDSGSWAAHVVAPGLSQAVGVRPVPGHLDVLCGVSTGDDPLGTGRLLRVALADGAVTALPTPGYDRSNAYATVLADGSLLTCSGLGMALGSAGLLVEYVARTSERYDPTTRRWRPTGRLAAEHISFDRGNDVLTSLGPDALIVAGSDQVSTYTDVVEYFSAGTGLWSARAPLPDARDGHSTTALNGDTVVVIGGENSSGVCSDGYSYDLSADVWSALPPMSRPRQGHVAVALSDGRVLVIGGDEDGSCEILS